MLRRFLRLSGHDSFDDFELMILVHEAEFESKEAKFATVVRITAGSHSVKTDSNSNGIFQQPLHITVEQGSDEVVVDLLNSHGQVLATTSLDSADLLRPDSLKPEMVCAMKQRSKKLRNPKIKLSMVVYKDEDVEKGLLASGSVTSDVDILVRQQLRKAKDEGTRRSAEGGFSEMEVLRHACCGPLEVFEGLGKTHTLYVGVLGPPATRSWKLCFWTDQHNFEARELPLREVEVMKIQSVQADPSRHHVFVINFFDETRMRQTLTLRRMDRARDVWVEILHLLVTKCRDSHAATHKSRSPHPSKNDHKVHHAAKHHM